MQQHSSIQLAACSGFYAKICLPKNHLLKCSEALAVSEWCSVLVTLLLLPDMEEDIEDEVFLRTEEEEDFRSWLEDTEVE